jgi:hypothetical protein
VQLSASDIRVGDDMAGIGVGGIEEHDGRRGVTAGQTAEGLREGRRLTALATMKAS